MIDGSDYQGTSGTLCWGDGDNADKTFTVVIIDDEEPEDDETFTDEAEKIGDIKIR